MAKAKTDAPTTIGAMDEKWRTEDDLRAFITVCEVKKDPKRMKRMAALAKSRQQELGYVTAEAKEKKD